MTDEQATLIALLEWELSIAQAEIAEWRERTGRLLAGADAVGSDPGFYPSTATARCKRRHLASLADLLCQPPGDKWLRVRLAAARWEAQARPTPPR